MATLPTEHMKDLLVAAGYKFDQAVPTDWNIWIGKQPAFPDRAITLYDGPGLAPNPRWLLDYPSVQIKCRGSQSDYKLAFEKAKDVQDLLLGIPSYTASSGDRIVLVNAIGDVAFTGWDDTTRPEFVFNLRLTIEPAPSASTHREVL